MAGSCICLVIKTPKSQPFRRPRLLLRHVFPTSRLLCPNGDGCHYARLLNNEHGWKHRVLGYRCLDEEDINNVLCLVEKAFLFSSRINSVIKSHPSELQEIFGIEPYFFRREIRKNKE